MHEKWKFKVFEVFGKQDGRWVESAASFMDRAEARRIGKALRDGNSFVTKYRTFSVDK